MGVSLSFIKIDKNKVEAKLIIALHEKGEFSYRQFLSINYSQSKEKEVINLINNQTNHFSHDLALSEFKHEKEVNIDTINQLFRLKKIKRQDSQVSDKINSILCVAALFDIALDLKEEIENYNGIIYIIHSY